MLLIHFADDAHGGEELEHLLVGNIVWVGPGDVALLAGVCGAVGLLHAVARRPFLAVTQRTGSVAHAALWDLLFYASFGLALTAIVSVAGVLLVFSTLVIPAVIARLLVVGVLARLLVAWGVGLGVGIAGVAVSYTHPTGPVIVALLGAALLVTLVVWAVRQATSPGAAIARVLGASALLAAAAAAFSALPVRTEHDHHEAPEDVAPTPADGLFSLDAAVRDATARQAAGNPDRVPAMERALALETDAAVRLTLAVALARSGDVHALQALAELTQCDVPYVRMEADARLRAVAGKAAPAYDPLAGPDEAGRWRAWAASVQKAPPGLTALPLP
jgi:ABC-type Mn2+/Zn2+ transport system permease subunit